MKKTTILTLVSVAAMLCASCDKNYHEVVAPDELGMPEHEYYIDETGGDLDVAYLSNKKGTITLVDPADKDWLQLGTTAFENDGDLPVHVLENNGFKRRADILFTTDTRKDTVSVFQSGTVEEKFFVFAESVLVMNGTGETHTVVTDINVPLSDVKTEVRYSGGEEWVKDCQLTNTALTFKTSDNSDRNYMRRALVVLTYKDGWDATQQGRHHLHSRRTAQRRHGERIHPSRGCHRRRLHRQHDRRQQRRRRAGGRLQAGHRCHRLLCQ